MRIAADMSSIGWTCLNAGKDKEGTRLEHEGRMVTVNSAAHGYEAMINHFLAAFRAARAMPKDLIMVFEGRGSNSPRVAISSGYKANRGSKHPLAYEEFSKMMDMVRENLSKLGAIAVTQDNVEGDDILAWLAQETESDLMVDSCDGDLVRLAGINAYGANIYVYNRGETNVNPFGDFPTDYITVYKALVGDVNDNIKGVKGFGVETWKKFLAEFGYSGLAEMARLAGQNTLNELVPEMHHPIIKLMVQDQAGFLKSWQLASLHPEWVNTLHDQLQWSPGLIKGKAGDERLDVYAGGEWLVDAPKWERFKGWFAEQLTASPFVALDIETSTSEESDEWLLAQGDPAGVDVIGSELTGMSLTFGANLQNTVYIPVDHAETANVAHTELRDLVATIHKAGLETVVHNYSFEGSVLYQLWGEDWKANGYEGFLPNALDTKFDASYVDENSPAGLKAIAKRVFNYDQVTYQEVTTIDEVPYKMRELTGAHVKSYGCDDTIVTASYHNFAELIMELEHTKHVQRMVEIDAMYAHTQSFVHGTRCDVARSKELEAIDDETYAEAEKTLMAYLIEHGWDGTLCPVMTLDPTPAEVKQAYLIVEGKPLDTAVRKPERLVEACREAGSELFATALEGLYAGSADQLNTLLGLRFTAKPVFNAGSTLQMQKLLYETMGLPVRVRTKPTDAMRKAGKREGNPQTNELAIAFAKLMDATPVQSEVLEALRLMKMVETRRGLYYSTYPYFVHWKTGRIHSSHNQASTNTRRASSSKPNLQQMPKNMKIEGQLARFREVIVPHKPGAVIVSMDFKAQELRVIADYSQDPNMLACFVGDNLRDMHAFTGLGIAQVKRPELNLDYHTFVEYLDDKSSPLHKVIKEFRALGKKCNFTTEFGALAPKLALTMMVSVEDAQLYIDAKEAAFPVVKTWKASVIEEAYDKGYVLTKLGARRHLAKSLTDSDRWVCMKAERQSVNFKVQSSSAEMTKLAEGRMWRGRLTQKFDAEIVGPIHDEVVASCMVEDLPEFIPAMHACMVQQYADMRVPILSSISLGPNFGVQFEIGDAPTLEAIQAGLAECAKFAENS